MGESGQDEIWDILYGRIRDLLAQHGREGVRRTADYWVDNDNIGTKQQKAYVRNVTLLRPHVIESLQQILSEFPGWEIMVAVSVPGGGDSWPDMGLTIRQHEIIDGLQRKYLPKEFLNVRYQGSRPGSEED